MNIKITNTDANMLKGLTELFLVQINNKISLKLSAIESYVKQLIQNKLVDTAEYRELSTNGEMSALFGFDIGREKNIADDFVAELIKQISVTFTEFHIKSINTIKGSILVEFNWGKALNTAAAQLLTDNGHTLKWAEWLLLWGDKIFVNDYTFLYRNNRTFTGSRSAHGLMIKGNARAARVNPFYSGHSEDNWLTRALNQDYADELSQYIFTRIL